MGVINDAFKPLEGYIFNIKRDTLNGWYTIEIGVPPKWVFKGNKTIDCNVLEKNDKGIFVEVTPKVDNILIDDLITFIQLIVDTNSKIAEKEKEFTAKMDQVKEELKSQAQNFYKELDELREQSFTMFTSDEDNSEMNDNKGGDKESNKGKRGPGRPPGSKNKKNVQKTE